jgi:hypothetical protein
MMNPGTTSAAKEVEPQSKAHLQQPREPPPQRRGLPAGLEPGRGDARHEERVERLDQAAAEGDGALGGEGVREVRSDTFLNWRWGREEKHTRL